MRDQGRTRLGRAARGLLPIAVIGFGLGSVVLPPVARAQFLGWDWGGAWGGLSPRDINQSIAQRGFRMIAPLQRNGAVFVADVLDRRGRRERLIVAAADGQILQRFLLDDSRLPGYVPRNRGQDDFGGQDGPTMRADREPRPVPPGVIPGIGANPGFDANPDMGARTNETDVEPVMPRPVPKVIKTPRPRIVERTPDSTSPAHEPPPASAVPSEPMPIGPRPKITDPLRIPPGETTAGRPAEPLPRPKAAPAAAASAPLPPDSGTSAKLSDPLRIPDGHAPPPKTATEPPRKATTTAAGSAPAGSVPLGTQAAPRIVPGSVTGAPAVSPKPAATSKPGDVPVAPLD